MGHVPADGRTPIPGEWAERGACRSWPTAWWYPGERTAGTKLETEAALHICKDLCPVREECLAHAMAHREPGIWGATTEPERRRRRQNEAKRRWRSTRKAS